MTSSEQPEQIESDLIACAIEGDPEAFGDLYERYLDRIYRYMYSRLRDHDEAEDLTESIFLKAWEALPRSRPKASRFRAWLFRIAHNAVVDHVRARKPTVSIEHVTEMQDERPAPERVIEAQQATAMLSATLARLKPRDLQVVLCRFVGNLSHAETAAVLGTSEGNVRVLQHRALKRMQRLWVEESR
jgi:RNA polymerase sigma-70 factor (ECF subfamily)